MLKGSAEPFTQERVEALVCRFKSVECEDRGVEDRVDVRAEGNVVHFLLAVLEGEEGVDGVLHPLG